MRARKRYGQHFLEAAWADKLIAAVAPAPDDRFLEIGPGPGALTLRLAPRVAKVTAVEVDADMIAALQPRLPPSVVLLHRDFLDFGIESLRPDMPLRVVGNLPYNVSSPILFRLIDAHRKWRAFTDATLMVQREVAERMQSGPGTKDYGVLSVLVQLHADVSIVLTLPPGAFRPAPRVRSAVVRLTFRPPLVTLPDEELFEAMVRSVFTQRRKTLSNALRPFAAKATGSDPDYGGEAVGWGSDPEMGVDRAVSGSDPDAALRWAGIDGRRRPETLQLTEFARLAEFFVSTKS